MAYGGNRSTPDMHMRKLSFLGFGVSSAIIIIYSNQSSFNHVIIYFVVLCWNEGI